MSFPVCEVAREPFALNTEYPLSDFLRETREKLKIGALIRFIPPPPAPRRDFVFGALTNDVVYPYESPGDPEAVLKIFGAWLPEAFEKIMQSENKKINAEHLFTDTPQHVMEQIGQKVPNKMAIIAKNFFEHYVENAKKNAMTALTPFMPTPCVHLIQAYMDKI